MLATRPATGVAVICMRTYSFGEANRRVCVTV
jgi:hypothetical protein